MWSLVILALGGTITMTYPTQPMCEAARARLRVTANCIEVEARHGSD